jgi:LEA14-like dessication related protein
MKITMAISRTPHWFVTCALLMVIGRVGVVMPAELIAPAISIAGIHSPTLSAEGARLICSVRVENPNDVALPLTGADVKLKLGGAPAAKGRLLKNITIPARGLSDVDLLVDLDMASAVTWLPMFLDDQAFTVPFEVDGYVDVDQTDLGRVSFHETGEVSMTDAGLETTPSP